MRLGGSPDDVFGPIPKKPPGMWRRTLNASQSRTMALIGAAAPFDRHLMEIKTRWRLSCQ